MRKKVPEDKKRKHVSFSIDPEVYELWVKYWAQIPQIAVTRGISIFSAFEIASESISLIVASFCIVDKSVSGIHTVNRFDE